MCKLTCQLKPNVLIKNYFDSNANVEQGKIKPKCLHVSSHANPTFMSAPTTSPSQITHVKT